MLRCLSYVAGAMVLSAVAVFGQAVAEVNGSAADQSGAVLPGLTIPLTEEATGLVRKGVSNATGRFVISALTPGGYRIKAELSGFTTPPRTRIEVTVGQA